MNSRQIILFIVEGISDKDSLGLILSKLLSPYLVEFYIVGGDVTSEYQSKSYNIEAKLKRFIDLFLKDHKGFKKTDIKKIVHLVDIDGVYTDEENIIYDAAVSKTNYESGCIITNKVDKVIERNERKKAILDRLSKTNLLWGCDYDIYYFSCHLEHVLHQLLNVPSHNKDKLAIAFVESFVNREADFLRFLDDLLMENDYQKSWDYIKLENHSLERNTNFSIGIHDILENIVGD